MVQNLYISFFRTNFRYGPQTSNHIVVNLAGFSGGFSAFQKGMRLVGQAPYTPKPKLLLSAFRFEDIPHRTARNRFAFHGITSEDDFGF